MKANLSQIKLDRRIAAAVAQATLNVPAMRDGTPAGATGPPLPIP
jgi:hypothetical protein